MLFTTANQLFFLLTKAMNPRKILQNWILPDGKSLSVSDEGEQKYMPMLVNASVNNMERNDNEGLQCVIRTKSFELGLRHS